METLSALTMGSETLPPVQFPEQGYSYKDKNECGQKVVSVCSGLQNNQEIQNVYISNGMYLRQPSQRFLTGMFYWLMDVHYLSVL